MDIGNRALVRKIQVEAINLGIRLHVIVTIYTSVRHHNASSVLVTGRCRSYIESTADGEGSVLGV